MVGSEPTAPPGKTHIVLTMLGSWAAAVCAGMIAFRPVVSIAQAISSSTLPRPLSTVMQRPWWEVSSFVVLSVAALACAWLSGRGALRRSRDAEVGGLVWMVAFLSSMLAGVYALLVLTGYLIVTFVTSRL